MNCSRCGAPLAPGARHCTYCGTPVGSMQSAPRGYQQPQAYRSNSYINENSLPPQYRPLGAWAYFGYSLLFTIPIVGFILLVIFSLNDDNINRRNFARSYWCMLALAVILYVFVFMMLGVGYMI